MPHFFQCDSLQKHVSIINDDLKELERRLRESQRNVQLADEDLVRARTVYTINYAKFNRFQLAPNCYVKFILFHSRQPPE